MIYLLLAHFNFQRVIPCTLSVKLNAAYLRATASIDQTMAQVEKIDFAPFLAIY